MGPGVKTFENRCFNLFILSLPQPERINPELNQKGYSVKSDIWSLGITMVRVFTFFEPIWKWWWPTFFGRGEDLEYLLGILKDAGGDSYDGLTCIVSQVKSGSLLTSLGIAVWVFQSSLLVTCLGVK